MPRAGRACSGIDRRVLEKVLFIREPLESVGLVAGASEAPDCAGSGLRGFRINRQRSLTGSEVVLNSHSEKRLPVSACRACANGFG